ncbi:unnamed protein product [Leuciscus chuanchicus]
MDSNRFRRLRPLTCGSAAQTVLPVGASEMPGLSPLPPPLIYPEGIAARIRKDQRIEGNRICRLSPMTHVGLVQTAQPVGASEMPGLRPQLLPQRCPEGIATTQNRKGQRMESNKLPKLRFLTCDSLAETAQPVGASEMPRRRPLPPPQRCPEGMCTTPIRKDHKMEVKKFRRLRPLQRFRLAQTAQPVGSSETSATASEMSRRHSYDAGFPAACRNQAVSRSDEGPSPGPDDNAVLKCQLVSPYGGSLYHSR